MKQGSKLVLALATVGALGAAATAFAHGGDRARHGAEGADGCPMMQSTMQQGEHGTGHGAMAHRMGRGDAHAAPHDPAKPEAGEARK